MSIQNRITGTFLDSMCCDIASQNWGKQEWIDEFQIMKDLGFDTVVLIRAGAADKALWETKVYPVAIVPDFDIVQLYLDEAHKHDMKLFFGLFDTVNYWLRYDWKTEAGINIRFFDEAWERYGGHPALYGWYMVHEVGADEYNIDKLWRPIIEHIRTKHPEGKVLISPRYWGPKWMKKAKRQESDALTPAEHVFQFDQLFQRCADLIDYAAWMDGNCNFVELENYIAATSELCAAHNIEFWSNLETFERDLSHVYPVEPIEWARMRFKIEAAQNHVSKIITFEQPHFFSPNATNFAARNLYKRYGEYLRDIKQI